MNTWYRRICIPPSTEGPLSERTQPVILVVDDDPKLADLYTAYLEESHIA